jgi:hypothetical protein
LTAANEITVQSRAAQIYRHGLALKRKREPVTRHPPGQYRQHVVDGAPTFLQQHVAEEPSLFRRKRMNKLAKHSMVRGFEEEAALGNQLLHNGVRRFVDQLINNGFVGVNRST